MPLSIEFQIYISAEMFDWVCSQPQSGLYLSITGWYFYCNNDTLPIYHIINTGCKSIRIPDYGRGSPVIFHESRFPEEHPNMLRNLISELDKINSAIQEAELMYKTHKLKQMIPNS